MGRSYRDNTLHALLAVPGDLTIEGVRPLRRGRETEMVCPSGTSLSSIRSSMVKV